MNTTTRRVPPPSGSMDRPGSRPTKTTTRVGAAPEAPGSSPRQEGVDLPMPHERDEAPGHTATQPNPVIEQARRDLASGQVDTDMRATPGLDAARREALAGAPQALSTEVKTPAAGGDPSDADVGRGRHDEASAADRPRTGPPRR